MSPEEQIIDELKKDNAELERVSELRMQEIRRLRAVVNQLENEIEAFHMQSEQQSLLQKISLLCLKDNVQIISIHSVTLQDYTRTMVMVRRTENYEPFVTWEVLNADTTEGVCFEMGHYFQEEEHAIADFFKRIEKISGKEVLKSVIIDDMLTELKRRGLPK